MLVNKLWYALSCSKQGPCVLMSMYGCQGIGDPNTTYQTRRLIAKDISWSFMIPSATRSWYVRIRNISSMMFWTVHMPNGRRRVLYVSPQEISKKYFDVLTKFRGGAVVDFAMWSPYFKENNFPPGLVNARSPPESRAGAWGFRADRERTSA